MGTLAPAITADAHGMAHKRHPLYVTLTACGKHSTGYPPDPTALRCMECFQEAYSAV